MPNVEIPLMEAGDIVMENDAKIATHYIQSGEFYNKPLRCVLYDFSRRDAQY